MAIEKKVWIIFQNWKRERKYAYSKKQENWKRESNEKDIIKWIKKKQTKQKTKNKYNNKQTKFKH